MPQCWRCGSVLKVAPWPPTDRWPEAGKLLEMKISLVGGAAKRRETEQTGQPRRRRMAFRERRRASATVGQDRDHWSSSEQGEFIRAIAETSPRHALDGGFERQMHPPQCGSARGLDADRRAKPLKSLQLGEVNPWCRSTPCPSGKASGHSARLSCEDVGIRSSACSIADALPTLTFVIDSPP
jgi:hypothetical protein